MPILENIVNSGRDYVSNTVSNARSQFNDISNTVQNFAGDPIGFVKGALANGATESLFDVLGLAGSGYGDSGYRLNISCPDRNIYCSAFLAEEFTYGVSAEYEAPFAEGIDIGTGSGLFGFSGLGATGDRIDNSITGGLVRLARAGRRASSQLMTMQIWQGTSHINFSAPLLFVFHSDTERDVQSKIRDLQKLVLPRRGNQAGEIISPGAKMQLRPGAADALAANVGNFLTRDVPKFVLEDAGEVIQGTTDSINSAIATIGTDEGVIQGLATGAGKSVIGLNEAALQRELFAVSSIDTFLSHFDQKDRTQVEIGNFLYFDSVVITEVDVTNQVRLDRHQGKPIMAEANVSFSTFLMPFAEDLDTIVRR